MRLSLFCFWVGLYLVATPAWALDAGQTYLCGEKKEDALAAKRDQYTVIVAGLELVTDPEINKLGAEGEEFDKLIISKVTVSSRDPKTRERFKQVASFYALGVQGDVLVTFNAEKVHKFRLAFYDDQLEESNFDFDTAKNISVNCKIVNNEGE